MRKNFLPALILAVSALAGAGVAATAAAPPAPMDQANAADEGPGGPGGHHHGWMMKQREFSPTKHLDGRLAYLKAELKIKPAQESAWKDFDAASRKSATILDEARGGQDGKSAHDLAVPARLDLAEKRMTARLDALKTVKGPANKLYSGLDDDQKKTADEMFMRPMGFR